MVFEGDKTGMTRSLSNRETEDIFSTLVEKTIVSLMFHSIIYQKKEDLIYRFDFISKAA